MNSEILLEIIAANREDLMLSSRAALNTLPALHRDFDKIADENIILSLALNDSIASMLFYADYEKAIVRSDEVIIRFRNTKNRYLISRHLGVIGRCQALSAKHDLANESLTKALKIAKTELIQSDDTIRHMADLLHDLAMNNDISRGDPKKSILYLGKALNLLESTRFDIRKGICLMGLGNIRYTERKKKTALTFYHKAAKIFEEKSNVFNLAAAYSNIGLCYSELGQTDQVEMYLMKSLDLRLRTGNDDTIANSYFNLGKFYDLQNDVDKTYDNMLTCRNYALKCSSKKIYLDALLWLESISLKRNDRDHVALFREERLSAFPS
jgi:tetratricopeptide (TPR) repeat protein